MYTDFQSKLLYKQTTISEEGHDVLSCVHALSWKMPGSLASITTRTRMTIVTNFADPDYPDVFAANIELWRESGWITLEEYFDDSLTTCSCPEEIEIKCLRVLELFFVGSLEEEKPKPKYKPKKPIEKTTIKRRPAKVAKTSKKSEKDTKKEEAVLEPNPDFDWI